MEYETVKNNFANRKCIYRVTIFDFYINVD